ncbi:DMT family transporter [Halalkalibacterium ligniniphilum]|uniref:DMT family transporter n=1 Tax=Halalkalibacterium ligniniphilum TaxID=1134413 RepID=UPI00034B5F67|nr:EamA family transporter [Halalkalibacterium ligniniphilum]
MGSLFALLAALGFSLSNVMIKRGTTKASKNNGAFLSILITALLSGFAFIVVGLSNGWPIINVNGFIWFCIAGVLTTFLGRTLLYNSIQYLGSIRATAIKRLNPFFAVILGVLLLNEPFTLPLFLGMILIFSSFAMIIYDNYKANTDNVNKQLAADVEAPETNLTTKNRRRFNLKKDLNITYLYGIFSALCYAFGYVARKIGLGEIPEPFFGSMLGAGVGAILFVITAMFRERYRVAVIATFTKFEIWLIMAGVFSSLGQIFYFIALSKIEVSRVALIASTEVLLTIFLSMFFLKNYETYSRMVIFAALLGMVGAMILAVG